eukprot:PhM_4_TR2114/c1_g3_i1/m.57614
MFTTAAHATVHFEIRSTEADNGDNNTGGCNNTDTSYRDNNTRATASSADARSTEAANGYCGYNNTGGCNNTDASYCDNKSTGIRSTEADNGDNNNNGGYNNTGGCNNNDASY